jgi:hypothetical protein
MQKILLIIVSSLACKWPYGFVRRTQDFTPGDHGPSSYPSPSKWEAVKIFKWREGKAHLVARGRVKFMPPKPGGRKRPEKHVPHFRRATLAPWQYFYINKLILASASVD